MIDTKMQKNEHVETKHYKGYWMTKFVDFFPLLGFLAIVLLFGIATRGRMFNMLNIKTIWNQSFLFIVGGLGVIFCYAQGVHDFSLASNIAISAILGQMVGGDNPIITILVTLAVGTTIGAVNGFLYATTGASDFILTLSMNFMISGVLSTIMADKAYLPGNETLMRFNGQTFENIVIVTATLIVGYVFYFTKYGRHCKALSEGPVAANQSGVNVRWVKFSAFLIAGFTAGVIALLSMIRAGTVGSSTGTMFHFNVMICMIIGGMPLEGGKDAKLVNVFFGALGTMALTNGMVMLGLSSRMQDVVKGVVFITVAVGMTRLRKKANSI